MRIAMWSGPRNLSTAMMYAFAARGDCAPWDEPFYAAYLHETGQNHPMRDAIVGSNWTDPDRVVIDLTAALPDPAQHAYFKLMTHHMLADFPLDWAAECVNVHLIRHPARVLASYTAKRDTVTLEDIGAPQSIDLFHHLPGPVIDSADIRADPAGMLQKLCAEIGLDYTPDMLAWPEGPKPFDGIWAAHWYGAVHRSRGFAGPEGVMPELPAVHGETLRAALPLYSDMKARALRLD